MTPPQLVRASLPVDPSTSSPLTLVQPIKPRDSKTPITYDIQLIPPVHFLDDPHGKPTRNQIAESESRKNFLSVIAKYANSDGTNMYASIELLRFSAGCSERTARRRKSALMAAGFLTCTSRDGRTDVCCVHIPDHVWTSVQSGIAEIKRQAENKRGATNVTGVDSDTPATMKVFDPGHHEGDTPATMRVLTPATYVAPYLSNTSQNTSLSISQAQNTREREQDSLKSDGPKQIHGQRRNFKDEANAVAVELINMSDELVDFWPDHKTVFADSLKAGYGAKEIESAFGRFLAKTDLTDKVQLKFANLNFCKGLVDNMEAMRSKKAKQELERKAVAATTVRMQQEAEAARIKRQAEAQAAKDLEEDELPD